MRIMKRIGPMTDAEMMVAILKLATTKDSSVLLLGTKHHIRKVVWLHKHTSPTLLPGRNNHDPHPTHASLRSTSQANTTPYFFANFGPLLLRNHYRASMMSCMVGLGEVRSVRIGRDGNLDGKLSSRDRGEGGEVALEKRNGFLNCGRIWVI